MRLNNLTDNLIKLFFLDKNRDWNWTSDKVMPLNFTLSIAEEELEYRITFQSYKL